MTTPRQALIRDRPGAWVRCPSAHLEVDADRRILAAEAADMGRREAGLSLAVRRSGGVGQVSRTLSGGPGGSSPEAPAGPRRCPGLPGGLIASQGVDLDFGSLPPRCTLRVPLGGDARA